MNPKSFLKIAGVVLVVVGVLGFVGGVIGPSAEQSIFGSAWWFDGAENWAHAVLGLVALIAAFALSNKAQKTLVVVVGIAAVLAGLYSLFGYDMLWGANLENPLDSILHLVVGAWALMAAGKGKDQPGMQM